MCLCTIDERINTKGMQREGKYLICWKAAQEGTGPKRAGWWPACYAQRRFKPGWNKAPEREPITATWSMYKYKPYFHAFTRRIDAVAFGGVAIRCKVRRGDITCTGEQSVYGEHKRCVVAKEIWIPPYPQKR